MGWGIMTARKDSQSYSGLADLNVWRSELPDSEERLAIIIMEKTLETWKELLKLKIGHFTDESGKLVWTFYKKDLEKLIKPKPLTKTQGKQHKRMIDGIFKN